MSGETKAQISGWTLETLCTHLGSRIDAQEKQNAEKFAHLEQLVDLGQEASQRAVDKAEAAQHAHNVSANEWRATLNDFKNSLINRVEFDRLYVEFSAFKLEAARIASLQQGQTETTKETRDDTRSLVALVISVASVIVTLIAVFMGRGI